MAAKSKKGTSHAGLRHRINRIEGQVRGIGNMIDEEKYCIDILTQMKAIRSAIKSLESKVLEEHLRNCVRDAVKSGNKNSSNAAIEEILKIIKKSAT